jgi:Family of unknown function (DUF6522)
MKPVEIRNGVVEVEASIVAEGLGLALPQFREQMQAGQITSLSERGTDADHGRHRLTFFSKHRRFRLVVDDSGAILQRSALDFGDAPLPKSVRKPGR